MGWIESLELEKWMINVFAGNPEYFAIIGVLTITFMAGFFRMTGLSMIFMVGVFLLMFSGYFSQTLVIFLVIIGGLAIGYWVSKIIRG